MTWIEKHFSTNKAFARWLLMWGLFIVAVCIVAYFVLEIRPFKMFSQDWVRHFDNKRAYSIEHPEKWIARNFDPPGYHNNRDRVMYAYDPPLLADDSGFRKAEISYQMSSNTSIAYLEEWLFELAGTNYEIRDSQYMTVQGYPAVYHLYSSGEYKIDFVAIARESDAFVLQMNSSEDCGELCTDLFTRFVASFRAISSE